jgi:hypothetical protein
VAMRTQAGIMHHAIVTRIDKRYKPARIYFTHFYAHTYNADDATIRISRMTNVAEMIEAGCLTRLDYDHFAGNRVLARARHLMAHQRPYDLFNENCEHACTWLRTGHSRSPQEEHYVWTCIAAVMHIAQGLVQAPIFPLFEDV